MHESNDHLLARAFWWTIFNSPYLFLYIFRLLPRIEIVKDVYGDQARKLQKCFSEGVIALQGKKEKAVVKNARIDGCSRNVFRYDDLKDKVKLEKVRTQL